MRRAVITLALVLAACGEQAEDDRPMAREDRAPGEAPLTPAPVGPAPEQLALLESRDCRLVAEAYADALERREFEFAARFWDDPVIDDARLEALFGAYAAPTIKIADIREGAAAGTRQCTVTGALSDAADDGKPLRQGKIVLHRADDIPAATAEQLRWTIRSSTFIEPMERSGKGKPA